MSDFPARFVVSFCNNGRPRLAVLGAGEVEGTVDLPTPPDIRVGGITGICAQDRLIHVALQCHPATILTLDADFNLLRRAEFPDLADLHGLLAAGDRLYIASTGTDQICSVRLPDLDDLQLVWTDGGAAADRSHLNDLAIADGALLVASFGPRLPGAMRDGAVRNVATGECLIRGLREPHSLAWHDGSLHVLESPTGDLVRVRPGFSPRRLLGLLGYARGLHIDDELIAIGRSGYRDLSRASLGERRMAPIVPDTASAALLQRSGVHVIHRAGGERRFIDTTDIGREIYQLLRLT